MPEAYRFDGCIYCEGCVGRAVHHEFYEIPLIRAIDTEHYLDAVAKFRGITRSNPASFGDWQFPKPLTEENIVEGAKCLYCDKPIEKERDK